MRLYQKIIFLVLILFNTPNIFAQIDSILASVSADSMMLTIKELTGALPIVINGNVDTIKTRLVLTTDNRLASQYINKRMKSMGLETEMQPFHGNYSRIPLNFTSISSTPKEQYPLWLCSDWGEIFSLENTNSSWRSRLKSATRQTDRLDWIVAQNQNIIIAMGRTGKIAQTDNGGLTWTRMYANVGPLVYFFTSSNGTAIAIEEGGIIWRSPNLGKNWSKVIIDTNISFTQGTFLGHDHVIIVGRDRFSPPSLGRMFESTDGGITWQAVQCTFDSPLNAVYSFDSLHVWIGTSKGEIYRTSSGGASWVKNTFSDTQSVAQKIFLLNHSNGWIITTNSKLFRTTDGGQSWNFTTKIDTPSLVSDFLFLDSLKGILVGNEFSDKRTSDGGLTWEDNTVPLLSNVIARLPGTTRPQRSIVLTAHSDCTVHPWLFGPLEYLIAPGADDDASGVAVLIELARVFTQFRIPLTLIFAALPDEERFNYGTGNLANKLLGQQDTLQLVFDFDMVGYDSLYPSKVTMTYWTDAGSINIFNRYGKILISKNIPLTLVGWRGAISANTAGFFGKGIPIAGLSEGAGSGSFMNPNYHKPTDTWQTINTSYLTNITRSAAALIYDLALSVVMEVKENNIPQSYFLGLPYPNPFNTSTNITFGLPHAAEISLVVYNSLGQQVDVIVKGQYDKGYHMVTWTASRMMSGVYFARLLIKPIDLKQENFIKVIKLILIK
ncbi:MAG: M28 family peptidase [Bacteroidetes bacterium]|nr:M28 family peptidase [Bacteroidota bacterium]MBU2584743.1 M28 family peptidase [Bacteroidota bacterium]